MWNDAAGYEAYVGHWSRSVAPDFLLGASVRTQVDRCKFSDLKEAIVIDLRNYLLFIAAGLAVIASPGPDIL